MDLARKILESVAECQDPAGILRTHLLKSITGAENVAQAAQDDRFIDLLHHLDLLVGAGFLTWRGRDPSSVELEGLTEPTFYHVTWAGYDLLDSLQQVICSVATV